jgi:hypothetical protein
MEVIEFSCLYAAAALRPPIDEKSIPERPMSRARFARRAAVFDP